MAVKKKRGETKEMEAEKILVVDDNKEIVYSISELLKYEGYEILKAYDGMEALDIMERENVDLILLDVMMPRLNGLSALMKLREKSRIPVIILSAKTEESDKVSGLTLGADDYIEKPYNPAELIARVKALIRRNQLYNSKPSLEEESHEKWVIEGKLFINTKENEVLVENEEIPLTDLEYKILLLLVTNKTKIFSVKNIYESVWQEEYIHSSGNTVMVHIKNLRGKLDKNPYTAGSIKTIWGKGYRFEG